MLNINLNKILKALKTYELNRADIFYILSVAAVSFGIIFFSSFFLRYSGDKAVVRYNNREIMKIDLKENQKITLEKKKYPLLLDDMVIEVRNREIAVVKEKSPYNYCQMTGFIRNSSQAIICQPNKVVIMIEEGKSRSEEWNDVDITVR